MFRNKREKERKKGRKTEKKKKKRTRSQDVKHRCVSRVVKFSRYPARMRCSSLTNIDTRRKNAGGRRRTLLLSLSLSLHFHSTRPMAARQLRRGIMRIAFPPCQHSCRIDLFYFFYALFIGTSDAQIG